jgi:hypothetical protein
LTVDTICDVQSREPGFPEIDRQLRQIEHFAIGVDEGSLLTVAVTLTHDLTAIIHRSGKAGLLKTVQRTQISYVTTVENKSMR